MRAPKLIFLICALLLLVPSQGQAEGGLRLAYPTFPPFHWADENGVLNGMFYEIVSEALEKRMGLTVVWTAYPWPRCQENLKTGKDDAILTVPTAERGQYTVTHRDPFYRKPLNVFTYLGHERMDDLRKVRTLEDLKQWGFSVVTYSGNGWHREHVESLGVKTYEASYLENVWKMLAEKRGDVVLEWSRGAWPDIRRAGVYDRIIDTAITISEMPFHLLIRKDSSYVNVLDEFDETISDMKRDGTIAAILTRYF